MDSVFVQARYVLKKGTRSEFYRKFRDNNIREFSKSESGNIDYEIYFPLDSENDVCFLEKWESMEAQKNHSNTLHYAILAELKSKYVEKIQIEKYRIEPMVDL